jgi:hypothetical protein
MGILLISFIGILLSLIFITLSVIHIYWGLGGKSGFDAAIPTNERNEKLLSPKMTACFTVAFGLLLFALIISVKSGLINISLPRSVADYGVWIIAAIFLLRSIGDFRYIGFFKKVRSTSFGKSDSRYYSPLCLIISILSIALAIYG